MKTFKIFLLPVLCLFLTACRTSRQVVKNNETKTNQVTEIKTTYRDTVFYTKKAETSLKIPVSELKKCPETVLKHSLNSVSKPKIWTQKNGNAKAIIEVLHDTVTVTAECDSIALEAKIRAEYLSRITESEKNSDQLTKEKTDVNGWMIAGLIGIAFITGIVTRSLI